MFNVSIINGTQNVNELKSSTSNNDNYYNEKHLKMTSDKLKILNSSTNANISSGGYILDDASNGITNIPSGAVSNLTISDINNLTHNNQQNTTTSNDNNNWPPFDWFELPKMENLADFFKLSCSTAVIFGGLIPYIPQYINIKQSNNSDGFSTYGKLLPSSFSPSIHLFIHSLDGHWSRENLNEKLTFLDFY